MRNGEPDPATAAFVAHRNLLFTVAYELLGSAADAEDVVQETWLRWAAVDPERVEQPRAYLVRIATRQALNRLRTVQRRREDYPGEWLPEPLLTMPDAAEDVELAERVSVAMLHVLETLAPMERAVFVLREVFDVPYEEIGEAVDRAPAAVRQIAHRARQHVAARRPAAAPPSRETAAALDAFQAAMRAGDVPAVLALLAPEVVLVADGGGVRTAALRPILGADRVARFLFGVLEKAVGVVSVEAAVVNAEPSLLLRLDDELDGVLTAAVEAGRITRIFYVRNPAKLSRLGSATALMLR